MLDPDAMIESLDRFTAELVSQASHLNKDDDKYRVSTGDNTWNDDTSPAEITLPSISGSAPNIITFSNEDDSHHVENNIDILDENEKPSNDFSSINTSTMTDSTLIAMEATKMASVFKNEAEMSFSITSANSLELDHVQPPSHLNSLTNSASGLEKLVPKSPKLVARKKSLPAGLMVRRALNHSLNHGSSLESIENLSLSNLDHVNPPSDFIYDMDNSLTSVASLPNEQEIKTDFLIYGSVRKDAQNPSHPIFHVKQPFTNFNFSCNELEDINPPSLFNEITDFCNSLADVPTEAICSETEHFEDCFSHTIDDNATIAEDEITEFSDAHSATPLLSEISSTECTPKRAKSLSKSMTTKQRRNLARDRYKTYTVAAEMVMREAEAMTKGAQTLDSEEYSTGQDVSQSTVCDTTTYVTPTKTVSQTRLSAKDKRRMNRSRFETQVLDQAVTAALQKSLIGSSAQTPVEEQNVLSSDANSSISSPAQSPARTKLSIRRNFIQKRLENKDRFRTQTLSESSFSPDISSSSPLMNGDNEIHLQLEKDANLVLKTLRETKTTHDELIDCETLSLVSNDDDSEHNSGGSMNYRTYHKSWSIRKDMTPVNTSFEPDVLPVDPVMVDDVNSNSEEEAEVKVIGKPKIVKPTEKQLSEENIIIEEQVKGIRGRRKPLYSKSNSNKPAPKSIKPARTVTSNLVKNVTATLISGTLLKSAPNKLNKTIPARPKTAAVNSRATNGSGSRSVSNSSSPKTSPAHTATVAKSSPKHTSRTTPSSKQSNNNSPKGTPPMERQGTFTKEESGPGTVQKTPTSKIPTPSSTKIPAISSKLNTKSPPVNSRIPANNNSSKPPTPRNGYAKSISSDRMNRNNPRVYNRSTSADSREPSRKIQNSPSTQSLKSEAKAPQQNGAAKKSSIPSLTQRCSSNSSLNSNSGSIAKKQVTSKIASLWKKVEDSKKQPPKNDTRQWIQAVEPDPEQPRLIRSNTFDNKDGIVLRSQPTANDRDPAKCISRLGSFVLVDDNGDNIRLQGAVPASAVANV